jgi:hypothetical protein
LILANPFRTKSNKPSADQEFPQVTCLGII